MGSIFSASAQSVDDRIEQMIYYPPAIPPSNFNSLNNERSEFFTLTTISNNQIGVVIVHPKNINSTKYLVFSHGNGSDIYTMYDYFVCLSNMLQVNVVGYDYVGYGISRNVRPSETGCYESMECIMNYLLNNRKISPRNIYLMGQSLGTGVVVDYIAKHDWRNPVILISPYKSICRVVSDTSCIKPIDKFTSLDKLKKVNCPIKVFHGMNDEVINVAHGVAIYHNLNNKKFPPVWFTNTGHNDILHKISREELMEVLQD